MGRHWSVFIFWDPSSVLCNDHLPHWSCKARIARKDYKVSKTQLGLGNSQVLFRLSKYRNFSLSPPTGGLWSMYLTYAMYGAYLVLSM